MRAAREGIHRCASVPRVKGSCAARSGHRPRRRLRRPARLLSCQVASGDRGRHGVTRGQRYRAADMIHVVAFGALDLRWAIVPVLRSRGQSSA